MLSAVGHPTAVNPDRALRKAALERGWPVLQFTRPGAACGPASPSRRPPVVTGAAVGVGAAVVGPGLVRAAPRAALLGATGRRRPARPLLRTTPPPRRLSTPSQRTGRPRRPGTAGRRAPQPLVGDPAVVFTVVVAWLAALAVTVGAVVFGQTARTGRRRHRRTRPSPAWACSCRCPGPGSCSWAPSLPGRSRGAGSSRRHPAPRRVLVVALARPAPRPDEPLPQRRPRAVSRGAGSRRWPGPRGRRARSPGSSAPASRPRPSGSPGAVAGQGVVVGRPAQLGEPDLGHGHGLGVEAAGDPGQPGGRARDDAVGDCRTGASAASSPCTSAATSTAGTDVSPVTRANSPASRGPACAAGRPSSPALGQVGRGQHVQPGQHLARRPRPRLDHRAERRRHPQRALHDGILDLARAAARPAAPSRPSSAADARAPRSADSVLTPADSRRSTLWPSSRSTAARASSAASARRAGRAAGRGRRRPAGGRPGARHRRAQGWSRRRRYEGRESPRPPGACSSTCPPPDLPGRPRSGPSPCSSCWCSPRPACPRRSTASTSSSSASARAC